LWPSVKGKVFNEFNTSMKLNRGKSILTQLFSVCFIAFLFLTYSSKAQEATAPDSAPAASVPAVASKGLESPEALSKGEAVFKANCKQCHAINEVVVGPALKDAHKRWPNKAELANFIKYPQKVIDGGNVYAKGLYDKYKQYMPNHDFLSEGDLDNVIAWIINESENPSTTAVAATSDGSAKTGEVGSASESDSSTLNIVLAVLMVVLLLMILILIIFINLISRYLRQNAQLDEVDTEVLEGKLNLFGFLTSGPVKVGVTFIFIIVLAKAGWDKVYGIGMQQGYAPKQPIAFSHKLHAGMYEIDCNYCHTGVNKGKSATIPSVNICMNCHNAIKTESPEIKKIYKAIESNKPIEWVRIHNLPDLAYFNHAQHVKVGGLECQKCHGPVQEMEVVEQYNSLTMGWCINCHRETVVKAEGNAYYDKLVTFHGEKGTKAMKVADIGGLECSKCHY